MYTTLAIINDDLFRLHSPVTGNADLTEFIPYLSIAQELYIAPLLGERLMIELKEQISTNTLSEANSRLIVKTAPSLSFLAVYQGLPFHWASIVNKGITIRESENSRGIDINDVAQLRLWIRNDADLFVRLLLDFLCEYQVDYPFWKPDRNYCDSCNKISTDFNSGFYFPSK